MLIVAGMLTVDPADRADYLEGCVGVIRQARRAPGCLDFALSGDLVDPARVNVFERWESRRHLSQFRGDGPSDDQRSRLLDISVQEFDLPDDSMGELAASVGIADTQSSRPSRIEQ